MVSGAVCSFAEPADLTIVSLDQVAVRFVGGISF
jgi:hypothetical protein